jgi:hypothetical protein
MFDAVAAAMLLCLLPLVAGLGVLTLQRWNADGQGVATGALLAACLGVVVLLSSPGYLSVLHGGGSLIAGQLAVSVAQSLSFTGLVVSVVMTPIVVAEVLLRWVSGRDVPISQGTFLVVRWIGSLLVVSAGSLLVQEEGLSRLAQLFSSMRM